MMTSSAYSRNRDYPLRQPALPIEAKFFLASVAAVGLTVIEIVVLKWTHPDVSVLAVYLMLCIMGAMWKVRLPGMTSTMSVSFLFVLLGMSALNFSQAVLLGCVSAFVQSFWEAKQPPKPIQIVFNVSSWGISVAAAFTTSHYVNGLRGFRSPVTLLVVAAAIFFASHTALLTTVLSLTGEGSFRKIWRQFVRWSLSYYVVGTVLAAGITLCNRTMGWSASLLMLLPSIYFSHALYRDHVTRHQKILTT
jgi:hypothetical protein